MPGGVALDACASIINGGVLLEHEFHANGALYFLDAQIGTKFSCAEASIHNPNEYALLANNLRVDGNVFLNGFSSSGKIHSRVRRILWKF